MLALMRPTFLSLYDISQTRRCPKPVNCAHHGGGSDSLQAARFVGMKVTSVGDVGHVPVTSTTL